MNISQHKLKRFLNLLPDWAGVFPTIHKNFLGRSLENTALGGHMKCPASRQNGVSIGGIILSVTLNQHAPSAQLLPADLFHGCLLFLTVGIFDGLFLHGAAKRINVLVGNCESCAQRLIEVAVAAFKHQLFDHVFGGETGGSGDADIYTAVPA